MDDGVRINKFLGSAGYCSRREADRLVGEGRVFIDGNMADMGSRVMPGQKVYVDGKAVVPEEENILIAVNKPRGIVCTTTDKQGANNIVDFLGCDKRIYPVGRLDKDSEGLLLMTNDGELMNNILTGKNEHEKEYIVEVDKNLSDDFERRMSEPMYLKELDKTTRPCRVIKAGKKTFRIILKQGLNRQIRRMCSNLGYKVVKLKRIRIMNIELNDLPAGATRKIEGSEYEKLMNLINKKLGQKVVTEMTDLERIKELVSILNKAGKSYYSEGVEIMSNFEYDKLYDELVKLEEKTKIVLSDSPTVNVGYETLSELPKERHDSPMLSLDKTKNSDELVDWLGSQRGLLSWKLDGLTIVLTYENGELLKAVTRGNGEVGEIITQNAKVFKNVPLSIPFKGRLVIRGEAIITYSDFEKINE